MAGRDERWRLRERLPEKGQDFGDDPIWVTGSDLRPGKIEVLAERFSGRPFEEMLRDPEFKRLSEEEVVALTAEFRRRAAHARGR